MSWLTNIVYAEISKNVIPQITSERRTVETNVDGGYDSNGYWEDGTTVSNQQMRLIKTVTTVVVSEARGIDETTAKAAASETLTPGTNVGEYTSTVIGAKKANDAGAWTVTKTITTVVITYPGSNANNGWVTESPS